MKNDHKGPLIGFRSQISDIISKFALLDGVTIDPESGIMHMPEGFARLVQHKPTNTVGLVFSDDVQDLTGDVMSEDALKRVKHIAAYSCKGDVSQSLKWHSNYSNMINRLTQNLQEFREKKQDRCQKHFTQYGVRLDYQDKSLKNPALTQKQIHTFIQTDKLPIRLIKRTRTLS